MITNEKRASEFARLIGIYDTGASPRETLIDLLADARHWCDGYGLCIGTLDRIAHQLYSAQLAMERQP